MLYSIEFRKRDNLFHAGTKLPLDLFKFLRDFGCQHIYMPYVGLELGRRKFLLPKMLWKLAFEIEKNSEIFVVYPEDFGHTTLCAMFRFLKPWYHLRNIKLTCISIDINTVRFFEDDLMRDVAALNIFDKVVLQSPAMKKLVVEGNNFKPEVVLNGLFDYAVKVPFEGHRTLSHDICFAGNLHKSEFLHRFDGVHLKKCKFLLYGNGFTEDLADCGLIYKGTFHPDDLSSIEGSWGLVWDGDSVDGLQGFLGDYMRINSPHKSSMYICAGMPLITPEGSFVGSIVKEHGLGLVVNSIGELDDVIDAVTEEEYARMLENVRRYGDLMKSGAFIKLALGL